MATFKINFFRCSNCNRLIRFFSPNIGPSQVKCGYCNHIQFTGMSRWKKLSLVRKIFISLWELIFPYNLFFVSGFVTLGCIWVILDSIKSGVSDVHLGIFIYPIIAIILNSIKLIVNISQSNKIAPTWKLFKYW